MYYSWKKLVYCDPSDILLLFDVLPGLTLLSPNFWGMLKNVKGTHEIANRQQLTSNFMKYATSLYLQLYIVTKNV